MLDKFQRTYSLVVQTEDKINSIVIPNPFTLDFSISQPNYAALATANFRIKNLSSLSRNQIFKDYFNYEFYPDINFYAGYGGVNYLLFSGSIQEAYSYRIEGTTDFITYIDARAGISGIKNNFFTQSYQGPISQKQIITDIIARMAPLTVGYISPQFDVVYPRSRSFSKNAWDALKDETDGNCFISQGKVYCMVPGDILPTQAFLINAQTGLLGSPKRASASVVAEMLFEPRLQMGQQAKLESVDNDFLNNTYTIYGLEHSGVISDAVNGKCHTRVSMYIGAFPVFPALGITSKNLTIENPI